MVILPKKSWNVWNKDNRERVKRDEANARAEEEENQRRAEMAEQDVRLQVLRRRAGLPQTSTAGAAIIGPSDADGGFEHGSSQALGAANAEDGGYPALQAPRAASDDGSGGAGPASVSYPPLEAPRRGGSAPSVGSRHAARREEHVNFFADAERGQKQPSEKALERKKEHEKQLKKIGALVYLGQTVLDAKDQPWYAKVPSDGSAGAAGAADGSYGPAIAPAHATLPKAQAAEAAAARKAAAKQRRADGRQKSLDPLAAMREHLKAKAANSAAKQSQAQQQQQQQRHHCMLDDQRAGNDYRPHQPPGSRSRASSRTSPTSTMADLRRTRLQREEAARRQAAMLYTEPSRPEEEAADYSSLQRYSHFSSSTGGNANAKGRKRSRWDDDGSGDVSNREPSHSIGSSYVKPRYQERPDDDDGGGSSSDDDDDRHRHSKSKKEKKKSSKKHKKKSSHKKKKHKKNST